MKRSIALMLCFAAIFIDFTSRMLSIAIDGAFLCAALYLLKDYLFKGKTNE